MSGLRITKRVVDALEPGDGDAFIWDNQIRGFGLKCTPKGRKVYICQYRLAGVTKRFTIGVHGRFTPESARREAEQVLASASRGEDPAEARRRAQAEVSFGQICDRYLLEHVAVRNKPSTARETRRIVDLHLRPKFARAKLSTIRKSDIRDWHRGMRERPYMANRALACLSKIFSLCVNDWELRSDNPTHGISRFKEEKRARYLSPKEFMVFGRALIDAEKNGVNPIAIAAIRLMVLTGCRRQEILSLRKDYIDFEGSRLNLPDSKTGAKQVLLGQTAIDYLKSLCADTPGEFVLPSHQTGKHFVGVPKVWNSLRQTIGMEDVRLHDLRHTFASVAATGGESLLMIKSLLGHADIATTQRYSHLQDDPVKAVADRTSAAILAAMGKPHD